MRIASALSELIMHRFRWLQTSEPRRRLGRYRQERLDIPPDARASRVRADRAAGRLSGTARRADAYIKPKASGSLRRVRQRKRSRRRSWPIARWRSDSWRKVPCSLLSWLAFPAHLENFSSAVRPLRFPALVPLAKTLLPLQAWNPMHHVAARQPPAVKKSYKFWRIPAQQRRIS